MLAGLPEGDAPTPACCRDGSLLVVVGDITPARALDQVEKALSGWQADGRGADGAAGARRCPAGRCCWWTGPGAVQSKLRLGGQAPRAHGPDVPRRAGRQRHLRRLLLLAADQNIREDKGYTYSPFSSIRTLRGDVRVVTSADVATEVTAPALVEMLYELGRIATLRAKPDELEGTVQYLTGTLALGTATQAGLAETLADLLSDGMAVDWLQEYPARLAAVTLDDVQEAAARMLAPETMVKVVVGDADVVEAGLSMLTEVVRR